ncbi:hypothetical protein MLD38_027160 [Melastoma candidum]|uniref:Uncharacterized protein n=1 Tax=Melastoma candidum TaxID=119954 RepID=A0ACB9P272_9MYRT|nr:hypothetical protein MLD38_027160 [Melastoma candidum]
MRKSTSMDSESSSAAAAAEDESQHSPLRFHSPLRSDLGDPVETSPYASPESLRRTSEDKFTQWSPLHSPSPDAGKAVEKANRVENVNVRSTAMVVNKEVRQDMMHPMTKLGPSVGGVGDRSRAPETFFRRSRSGNVAMKTALCFRVLEVILCLISFAVMAADKTPGWSGDSFDRYKEYRYCLSVNVIAFLYSGAQACDLAYQMMTGKHFVHDYVHNYFDFFMDQILAYLLVSASSSAATRVNDWKTNWGGDKFTEMVSASVAMAFLAFLAFAVSALISGYNLCTHGYP